MHSLDPASPAALDSPAQPVPRVWKFWGTALWGFLIFVAMFVGQIAVVVIFVMKGGEPVALKAAIQGVAGSGLAISLSVIAGLPAVLAALWLAIRPTRTPFVDYLALRWTTWRHFVIGAGGLALLVFGWDMLSRLRGARSRPTLWSRC